MLTSLRTLTMFATAAVLTLPLLAATTAPATSAAHDPGAPSRYDLSLPAPTGSAPVATSNLHLVDRSRHDPWVPSEDHRDLMVSMYYPTWTPLGRSSKYMTAAESGAFLKAQREQGLPIPPEVPDDVLRTVRTNAIADALPLPRVGGRPLVLLSPGFSLSRSSMTGLATQLASRGYVVAAIDHSYESFGIEMPNGELKPCEACDVEDYSTIAPGRSKDMSFVLDRLLAKHSPWKHNWMIDPRRVGIAGHSIGGNSAATTMAQDKRIDAAVNLDGTFFDPVPRKLNRPFMMVGTDQLHTPDGKDETWPRDWKKLTGPRYWLTVANSGHFSFLDYPVLGQQFGMEDPSPLTGPRSMKITRSYVGAFFDRHLRGIGRPLLNGPSERFDEVDFHNP